MPLLTAQQISSLSVSLLVRSLVLPNTVSRIPGEEFAGDNGDTITVRVRNPRTARVQANPGAAITYDAINETPVNVSLTHLYDATRITDEMLSMEVVNYAGQVTEPQVASVAVGAEDQLADAMNAVASEGTFALAATPDDTRAVVTQARESLTEADLPAGDRFLAVAPDIMSRLLQVPEFVRADAMGDGASTALRDAVMGRIFGMTVVESNGIAAGTALAYHRSAFAFATRTPVTPTGANDAASSTRDGITVRVIHQYQPDILSDASVVSVFAGAGLVDGNRVFKMTTAAA